LDIIVKTVELNLARTAMWSLRDFSFEETKVKELNALLTYEAKQ
jgi:hypothetical protein